MHSKFTRLATVAAAITAASVATLGLGSSGALAGPPLGTNTLSPATGNTSTTFTLTPPSGASCTGSGSGTPSYRWQTYIVDAGVDASTLTYASGPNAVAGHFVSPLYDAAGGNPVQNQNPSASPLGLISGIPTFSFSSLAGSITTPGAYKIGFACTQAGNLDNGKYWETPITIGSVTASSFNYAFGSVPSAPVLASPLTAGDQTLAGSFTASPSTPATTGFTVTAHPASGPDVTLPVAAAGPFTLTGLTNGTAYDVSVTATNSTGNSAPSNIVSGTPNLAPRPPITGLTASQISGPGVHLVWTAPTGTAPTNYTVVFTPSVAGSPFTAPGTSLDVTGLIDGTPYSIAVTANYAAAPTTGPTATVPFTYAGAIIIQDLTVVRPAGALILTQRCGVNGALPAEPATAAGFPATAAVAASANQTGTAPTTGAAPGGPADPQFPSYPFPSPAAYPTHCGVNLGTGSFITTGALAGQYYSANGFINEVTVSDNRDTGAAWTVNGTMGTFSNGSSTFSGSRLGWSPKVNSVTSSQVVTAGPVVDPSITNDNTSGLGTARVLATATAGSATGIATLDARLKLLIPVTAAAGTFTGALSLSAI